MARSTSINVAIVDDHLLIREALSPWIENADANIHVVASVGSWGELMSHPNFPVPVVVLDVDLKDGLPLSVKIQSIRATGARVILMSALTDVETIRSALDAGALSYIVKSEPATVIVDAIRSAAAGKGKRFLSEEMVRLLDYPVDQSKPKLTMREQQVMSSYASGQSMKVVATSMLISEETARSYMKRIREKYRAVGVDLGTKVALREQAVKDGMIVS